jgi:uncharacterized protein YbjQ (UPF0145 family)
MTQEAQAPYRVGAEPNVRVLVTTSNAIDGYHVVGYLGVVRGIVVRSMSIGAGFLGGLKSLGGGNIKEYIDVCEVARHDAYVAMVQHAEQMGAHAIIAMRYDATEFAQGVTEVLAYGTAVQIARAGG